LRVQEFREQAATFIGEIQKVDKVELNDLLQGQHESRIESF